MCLFVLIYFYLHIGVPTMDNNEEITNTTQNTKAILLDTLEQQNKKLKLIRQNICKNESLYGKNCLCDYMNLKGMKKSGTTWITETLKQIQSYFCDKLQLHKTISYELCIEWRVGSYDRHELLLPHDIHNHKLMIHFSNRSEFLNELKNKRFCTITIFRDPRDRKVSAAHWNLKSSKITNSPKLFHKINKGTVGNYERILYDYNMYWNTFRNMEMKQPMKFYTCFYEHLMFNTFDQIKDILLFIGFYYLKDIVITDEDVNNILKRISRDALKKVSITKKDFKYRKGNVCGFYDELTDENVIIINNLTAHYLVPELVQKFNKTCKIP
eukprot:197795_1